MNRDELHQKHIKTVKKMLRLYTSYLVREMNEGGEKNLTEIIDNFVKENIRNVPNPEWKPDEPYRQQ